MIKKKVAQLINVKTIITFVVVAVFAMLALNQAILPSESLVIITMVIGFYFGTQKQKADDDGSL